MQNYKLQAFELQAFDWFNWMDPQERCDGKDRRRKIWKEKQNFIKTEQERLTTVTTRSLWLYNAEPTRDEHST